MSPQVDPWDDFKPERRDRKVADRSDLLQTIVPFMIIGALALLVGSFFLDMYVAGRRAKYANRNAWRMTEVEYRDYISGAPPTHVAWYVSMGLGALLGGVTAPVVWYVVRQRQLREIEEEKRRKKEKKKAMKGLPHGPPR